MTALAATLVHFVWQGALVALLLAVANLVLTGASSRYAAACTALAAMLALSAATYVALARQVPPANGGEASAGPATTAALPAASAGLATNLERAFPRLPAPTERAVVVCWLVGVAVLSVRLTGGWAAAARLSRRGIEQPPEAWRARIERLASSLGLSRPVRLLASTLVGAPAALGVLRPVILVPVGAFTALSVQELEAILAHELAHIRRHDFLANLLQSAAETLLFYHPAVWWVSHRIRVERENACDDLAVEASGDAAVYARALVGLEEGRTALPRLVTASTGGSLFERVRRLVTPQVVRPDRLPPSIAAVLTLVAIGVLGVAARVTPPIDERGTSWLATPESAVEAPAAATASKAPQAAPAAPGPLPAPAAKPRAARPAAPAPAASPAPAPKEAVAAAPHLSPSQLIAFRIHGVTPEFIEELRALGFQHASADDLVALRIHGVTPEFIRAMRAEGIDESLERYTAFRIHGVTAGFVHEMRSLGFLRLSADEATSFRIHGVTAGFVREVHALGYEKASAEDFTAMRIHGVTPEYIRAINTKYGERFSIKELVEARIDGIRGDER